MATTTYIPLSTPFVSQQEIIDALRVTIPSKWNIPIYDEYPSDVEAVRFGLYVSNVIASERNVYQLGIQYCGSIYNVVDTVTIVYVSFQKDPYENSVNDIISDLPTLEVDGLQLCEGYFSRTYSHELSYGPTRAAIHTWTFQLTRMNFNT
jgi:hypothetical protein